MKRIETLLEKISSTGLILYIAGIISLIACAIATVVKAMTWIDMLHYAGCIFGCGLTLNEILIYGAYFFGFGFALMMLGMLGLAFLSKATNKSTMKKHH